MRQDRQKRRAAEAALELIPDGDVLGVGTGSTVNQFIELLGERRAERIPAAIASSDETASRLEAIGIRVISLNQVGAYSVYVDGADEFEPGLALIKGGGAALTGEKVVVSVAETFVCIADESKRVDVLGAFPLPVEVLPIAREVVAERLRQLGGDPRVREGVVTDHGNPVLDVHGLRITDPIGLEFEIETTPGVVACGIFAKRPADIVLMGTDQGVQRFG